MNRILIDRKENELLNVKDNIAVLDIKNDINIKLDNTFTHYEINIINSKVNILGIYDESINIKW